MMIPNPNHTVETALRFRRKRRGEEKEKDSPALHHKNYHRIMARMAMKRLALEYRRTFYIQKQFSTHSLFLRIELEKRTRDVILQKSEKIHPKELRQVLWMRMICSCGSVTFKVHRIRIMMEDVFVVR